MLLICSSGQYTNEDGSVSKTGRFFFRLKIDHYQFFLRLLEIDHYELNHGTRLFNINHFKNLKKLVFPFLPHTYTPPDPQLSLTFNFLSSLSRVSPTSTLHHMYLYRPVSFRFVHILSSTFYWLTDTNTFTCKFKNLKNLTVIKTFTVIDSPGSRLFLFCNKIIKNLHNKHLLVLFPRCSA